MLYEKTLLRRMIESKRCEITGDWTKLHNEELHNLYSSPNIISRNKWRRMRWTGHLACMRKKTIPYMVLVGEPRGRRPLGRPRHRWEYIIKMDLRGIRWSGTDWINLF
jgi:hypothetical protein